MPLDLAADVALCDGVEPITLEQVGPTGSSSLPVPDALRRPVMQAELQLLAPQIALTTNDCVWHLPSASLAGIAPIAGDRIISQTTTWIVLAATLMTLDSRWRVVCRQAH